ncbi:hypothetical protein [Sporosarcina ureae]|uniref:hypothetical protein n=1 Tax=Sporosarcina ureae TaxID=1571 RepID=UPI0009DC76B5|nr:hypothetical protein [Sporosarcina ureae]ARF17809.1 hypothetical protein SporoP17a_11325 [Sporosarcina ureae]
MELMVYLLEVVTCDFESGMTGAIDQLRKLFVLLVIASVLVGCGGKQLSYSEVTVNKVDAEVKSFIDGIETADDPDGNGIYMYHETKKERFLYLNQNFLDNGKGFGEVDIRTDEDTFQIYLQENDEPTEDEHTLYKITLDRTYEYMRVFKDDEETYFQLIGV